MSPPSHLIPLLCRLQHVIPEGRPLLIIGGVDGGDQAGAQQLVKFLLLGEGGFELLDGTIESSAAEDVMFLVSDTSLQLYCPCELRDAVLKLTSLCERVSVHCPPEGLSMDDQEVYKIKAFMSMVRGFKAVSLPTPCATICSGIMKCAPMKQAMAVALEKWPIFQSVRDTPPLHACYTCYTLAT
jgi:hypothetical protein